MSNQFGKGIYKVFALLFFLGLVFILALPQFFDLRTREKTEECINNMKEVKAAAEQYMRDRDHLFTGTVDDLTRTRYLKTAHIQCPEQGKYTIMVDAETLEVTVVCNNIGRFPDHTLTSE